MFICIFHLVNSDISNYVGPFDTHKKADRFGDLWRRRQNVKDIGIERVEKPLTPEQCRQPARWESLMGPLKSSVKEK